MLPKYSEDVLRGLGVSGKGSYHLTLVDGHSLGLTVPELEDELKDGGGQSIIEISRLDISGTLNLNSNILTRFLLLPTVKLNSVYINDGLVVGSNEINNLINVVFAKAREVLVGKLTRVAEWKGTSITIPEVLQSQEPCQLSIQDNGLSLLTSGIELAGLKNLSRISLVNPSHIRIAGTTLAKTDHNKDIHGWDALMVEKRDCKVYVKLEALLSCPFTGRLDETIKILTDLPYRIIKDKGLEYLDLEFSNVNSEGVRRTYLANYEHYSEGINSNIYLYSISGGTEPTLRTSSLF